METNNRYPSPHRARLDGREILHSGGCGDTACGGADQGSRSHRTSDRLWLTVRHRHVSTHVESVFLPFSLMGRSLTAFAVTINSFYLIVSPKDPKKVLIPLRLTWTLHIVRIIIGGEA